MKKIFIYYSLTGNGDIVGDYLKKKNFDIRKVETSEELSKNKILKILQGGFLAGINHKSKLKDFDADIDKYKEVIIGSPIWNGRLSCPINTVLDKLDLKNKKVTFILYSGSGKAPKTDTKIKELYKEINIIHIKEPKKNNLDKYLKNI